MEDNEIHTKFFSLKVLTCIYDLQVSGEMNGMPGISIDDIVEQMCRRFITDGDVEAQVQISLKQICHKGLVAKVKDRYKLVGPMARILLMTHRNCQRQRQIEKIQRIFFNNCVGNSSTKSIILPRLRSQQKQMYEREHERILRDRDRERERNREHERVKRSYARSIASNRRKVSATKKIHLDNESSSHNNNNNNNSNNSNNNSSRIHIRDFVDFLQYDSSSCSSCNLTILPDNKKCKSVYQKSVCYYDCFKK